MISRFTLFAVGRARSLVGTGYCAPKAKSRLRQHRTEYGILVDILGMVGLKWPDWQKHKLAD